MLLVYHSHALMQSQLKTKELVSLHHTVYFKIKASDAECSLCTELIQHCAFINFTVAQPGEINSSLQEVGLYSYRILTFYEIIYTGKSQQ